MFRFKGLPISVAFLEFLAEPSLNPRVLTKFTMVLYEFYMSFSSTKCLGYQNNQASLPPTHFKLFLIGGACDTITSFSKSPALP